MPSNLRLQRIADRIREELSEIILFDVSDPRLTNITVTDVKVDREYAYANIYISAVEGHERSAEILAGLNHAKGYLRSTLAKRIQLRVFPRLRFYWDPTPEGADHIEQLLDSLKSETPDASDTVENEE